MNYRFIRRFYATDGGTTGSGESGSSDDQSSSGAGEQGNADSGTEESGKTFTQAELSAVAATEKKQGKQAILNLFGLKDEKTAKEQAEAFKKWQESQKNSEQKLQDTQKDLETAVSRADQAEAKLTCMLAGVTKDSISDALAIASTKVTEDKNLTEVLEEMKKEPRYKGFFITESGSSRGTGNPAGHNGSNGSGQKDNLGERLGKAKAADPKKSNYFTS